MLDRVPVLLLGGLVYAPALLVIGLLSGQPPLRVLIGLVVLAIPGLYIAHKLLRDFNLPSNAPLADLKAAIKRKRSQA